MANRKTDHQRDIDEMQDFMNRAADVSPAAKRKRRAEKAAENLRAGAEFAVKLPLFAVFVASMWLSARTGKK